MKKFISFKKYRNKIPAPFVVYADFEALNVPFTEEPKPITEKPKKPISTVKLSSHKICAYGYILVCCLDDIFSKSIKIYRGENAAHNFIEAMLQEEK